MFEILKNRRISTPGRTPVSQVFAYPVVIVTTIMFLMIALVYGLIPLLNTPEEDTTISGNQETCIDWPLEGGDNNLEWKPCNE